MRIMAVKSAKYITFFTTRCAYVQSDSIKVTAYFIWLTVL